MRAFRTNPARIPVVLFAGVLVASLLLAPDAFAVPKRAISPFGMTGHLIGNFTNAQVDRELDLIDRAGASWVRVDVPWRFMEPAQGLHPPLPFKQLDYIIAGASKRGIKVQAVVIEFPNWTNGGQGLWVPPTNDLYFENFMRFVSARYAGRITYWELGNEVNETEFWDVPRSTSARRYVRFLQHGYRGVKAGNPNAKVISAGLAGSDYNYLQELYDAGAKGYFDILGVHAYTHGRSPYAIDTKQPGSTFDGLARMKATLERNGDGAKRIWITEAGWQTSKVEYNVTEQQQATYVYQAYKRIFLEFPYVETLFIYSARDSGTSDGVACQNYGLLERDYSPKLSYTYFRRAQEVYEKAFTAVSLTASSRSVSAPADVTFSGVLRGAPGATVRVQRYSGGRWVTVRTLATGSDGGFSTSLRFRLCGTWRFRATYAGSASNRSAVSPTVSVTSR